MATTPFEQKFGILSNSAINEKMPGLEDDSLGFQVVQSEDDDSRGFGVQIYDIGKHLVLVPMFFLKGKIKGGEVMYVKDLNKFMPLTEMDVNTLKSGKKFSMGDVEDEKEKNKGTAYRVSTMELNWLNSKRAGEVSLVNVEDIQKMFEQSVDGQLLVNLNNVRMFGPKAAADLTKQLTTSPKLANALLSVHQAEEIYNALLPMVKAHDTIAKVASVRKHKPLVFIDDPYCKEAADLSDEQKRLLMQYGIVSIDNRKEASVAMKEKKAVTRWSSPKSNGKYDILMRDGSIVKGDILTVDADKMGYCECCSGPEYCSKEEAKVTVIIDDTITTKKVSDVCIDTNTVQPTSVGSEVTAEALRSLIVKDNESKWGDGKPFTKNAAIIYDQKHDIAYKGDIEVSGNEIVFKDGSKDLRIVLTGKSGALFVKSGILYVPNTAKIVKLYDYKEGSNWSSRQSDIVSAALVNGGFETVKVASDGRNWRVDDKRGGTEPSNYATNFRYLMENIGLRAKQANDILQAAKEQAGWNRMGEPISFWCKVAVQPPPPPNDLDPTEDPWFGTGDDHFITREAGKISGPLDEGAIERIRKASNTGVKEIVDTQLMSELAKSAYSVDKVQDYLPIISKALDRICRSLVMFYWHNEDFEERYGKQNMPQLEDALKDNIRAIGDLIGYLRDKSVQDTDENDEDNDDDLGQELA